MARSRKRSPASERALLFQAARNHGVVLVLDEMSTETTVRDLLVAGLLERNDVGASRADGLTGYRITGKGISHLSSAKSLWLTLDPSVRKRLQRLSDERPPQAADDRLGDFGSGPLAWRTGSGT